MTKEEALELRKGDLVICTESYCYGTGFIKGQIYIVREPYEIGDSLKVLRDSNGIRNGWSIACFEPVNVKAMKVLYGVEE